MNSIDIQPEERLTLGEHFHELRRRVLRAVIGVAAGMTLCLIFGDRIMQWATWPIAAAQHAADMPARLRTLAPGEALYTYLKVCLIWGAIIAAPYVLWQLWQFISAGLYPHEKRYVSRIIPFSLALFATGVLFFFVIVAPICLRYFLVFGQKAFLKPSTYSLMLPRQNDAPPPDPADNDPELSRIAVLQQDPPNPQNGQIWLNAADGKVRTCLDGKIWTVELTREHFLSAEPTLEHYIGFVSTLALVFGAGFQIPILVLVLVHTNIVPAQRLKSMRKYIILALLLLAGIMTPDPTFISQLALAVPMYLLFELGLLLGRKKTNPTEE